MRQGDGSANRLGRAAACLLVCAGTTAWLSGCRVNVEKGANGEDKNVQVDTPFGGVHVNTDQTTAADLGLPAYPGAESVKGPDDHKSANVHMGFGEWELRVQAVSYSTKDNREQVEAYYKKALGRYGEVITCEKNAAIGKPIVTSEGLTCDEKNHEHVNVNNGDDHLGTDNYELKAGSERHQHIVAFETTKDGETRFSLVALDLPSGMGRSGKSD
jgi:hypothetical protein